MQTLYLCVGFAILLVALLFLVGVRSDFRKGSYDFPEEKAEEDADGASSRAWVATTIIVIMTAYCTVSNGMSFAYGHFLTTYVVKSDFGKSAADGARLATYYYASQVLIRGVNIPLITRVSSFHMLISYLGMVACGTLVALSIPAFWGLQLGSVLIGLGAGSLFPMGLLWIQSRMELSGKATALLCVGTSVGAQIFRIPEGAYIDSVPMVHLYLLTVALLVTIVCFGVSYFLVMWKDNEELKDKERKEVANAVEHVETQMDSAEFEKTFQDKAFMFLQ